MCHCCIMSCVANGIALRRKLCKVMRYLAQRMFHNSTGMDGYSLMPGPQWKCGLGDKARVGTPPQKPFGLWAWSCDTEEYDLA